MVLQSNLPTPPAGKRQRCPKTISELQTLLTSAGERWCLDCVLRWAKRDDEALGGGYRDEARVNVSINLLGRLADGLLYSKPWGFNE